MEDGGLPVSRELEILDLNDIWSKAGALLPVVLQDLDHLQTLDSVGTGDENLQRLHLYTETQYLYGMLVYTEEGEPLTWGSRCLVTGYGMDILVCHGLTLRRLQI